MSRAKKLVTNTGLFAIANFGSKILTFLLVPLYTYVMSKDQYGCVDIMITTVSMLVPIITLSMADAAMRFAMDPERDKKKVFSTAVLISMTGIVVSLFLIPLFANLEEFKNYTALFYVILALNCMYSVSSQFARGNGCIWQFAVSGIVQTLTLIVSNIIFLVYFNLGVNGYLYSLIISYASAFLFVFLSSKLYKYIAKPELSILGKLMILYALPLIPNALFWWAMNAADKYVILYFMDSSANGLYAVSQKIPTVINMINVIFFQAWQISAIEEVNADDRGEYYSRVFKFLSTVMFVASSAIMLILRPLFKIWVSESYFDSWQPTPFLLLGTVFMCFASFWGTNFVALKKTVAVFKSTAIGFVFNMVLNIVLIPSCGLVAAAMATMIGYLVTWIVRMWDMRKYMKTKIDIPRFTASILILSLQCVTLFLPFYLIWNSILFAALIAVNFKYLVLISKQSFGIVKNKLLKRGKKS